MIISKTPFRISFFGGGTDYPKWYRVKKNVGKVLNVSIDKYSYIVCRYLPPFFNYKYRIRYYKREEVNSIEDIQHPVIRECIKKLNITYHSFSNEIEIMFNELKILLKIILVIPASRNIDD
jgi:D-glycero-alpha-D-manno-heptose-7-phosphate kinase